MREATPTEAAAGVGGVLGGYAQGSRHGFPACAGVHRPTSSRKCRGRSRKGVSTGGLEV